MKVLITGGSSSRCGTALHSLDHELVVLDRERLTDLNPDVKFFQADINDYDALDHAINGCRAIIHLAASSTLDTQWNEIISNNIEGTKAIFRAAVDHQIERVIFASTNHVVGMYELDNAPQIYQLGHGFMFDKFAPARPDSLYGVSKIFGENLGRYYAEHSGPKCYVVRIGCVLWADADHPYAIAEKAVRQREFKRNSQEYNLKISRDKGMWQSRRDFRQMIDLCLKYDGPAFDIFYGVSDNDRRWLDIEYAKEILGYQPEDNAENFTHPPTTIAE